MNKENVKIQSLRELAAQGLSCEVLLWVGCAGAFDERYKQVMRAFVKLLQLAKVHFGILGEEEGCTGDPARRAGNEFLFQLRATANIEVLNRYKIKKVVTSCPHCFNTIKCEYPALGGTYEVLHHSQYLYQLVKEGKILLKAPDKDTPVVYHDSCYLGRANDVYEPPRALLKAYSSSLLEMRRGRAHALCCGAGGAQMFKEAEPGKKEISTERTEEALATGAQVIASACPFCMTMLSDGVKAKNANVAVKDIAELLLEKADA